MKANRWMVLLIVGLLTLLPSSGLAWAPEGFFSTEADLPAAIHNELPAEESFLECFYNGSTAYLCTEASDGARRVRIFRETNGNWALIVQSGFFPNIDGQSPSFGSTTNNELYLFSGKHCYVFSEKGDGDWRLSYVQGKADFSWLSNGISWQDEYGSHTLYGDLPSFSLSEVDPASLPQTLAEARQLLHMEGWAVVNNPNPQDRLHLRAKPSQDAPSLGKYYTGTPVHILQTVGDWANVDIAGVQGYMMLRYLTLGAAMENVPSAFLCRVVTQQAAAVGVTIYAQPDLSSTVIGLMGKEDPNASSIRFHVIGVVGEDWYHIILDNDQSGYVQAKDFWAGNG